ncbi:MAG: dienelactone hydrolase family protein [Pseudomonadota bacterium]
MSKAGSIVSVPTVDGPMEVFFVSGNDNGSVPCALLYMDLFGLREEIFDLARAYANDGYSAAVPDLFHRLPVSRFHPANGRGEKPSEAAIRANSETTLQMSMSDSEALVTWLDTGSAGPRPSFYHAIGYCMGGRHALAAAATIPERIRSGMSVHGGRLVTQGNDSPHKLIANLKVPFRFVCASEDPTCPADHCEILKQASEDATASVTVEVLDSYHGWSFTERWAHDPKAAAYVHGLACAFMEGTAN